MPFEQQKKDILERIDKSRKGNIDSAIEPLVNLINSLNDYYTSSSCSGRISLLKVPSIHKKNEVKWIFSTHSETRIEDIKNALADPEGNTWFIQESLILHICCADLEAAEIMLSCCHKAGLKRAGIITMKNRIMIECFGTERIDTIVVKDSKKIVSDDYLMILISEANKKHKENIKRIERLYRIIHSSFQEAR